VEVRLGACREEVDVLPDEFGQIGTAGIPVKPPDGFDAGKGFPRVPSRFFGFSFFSVLQTTVVPSMTTVVLLPKGFDRTRMAYFSSIKPISFLPAFGTPFCFPALPLSSRSCVTPF
jgi:hypothetical protein